MPGYDAPLDGIVQGFTQARELQRQAAIDAAQRAMQANSINLENLKYSHDVDQDAFNNDYKNRSLEQQGTIAEGKAETARQATQNKLDLANLKWQALNIRDKGKRQEFLLKNAVPLDQIQGILSELDGHDASINASITHGQNLFPAPQLPGGPVPAPDTPASAPDPLVGNPGFLDVPGSAAPAPGPVDTPAAIAAATAPQAAPPAVSDPTVAAPPQAAPSLTQAGGQGYVLPGAQADITKKNSTALVNTSRAAHLDALTKSDDALREMRVGNIKSIEDYRTWHQTFAETQAKAKQERDAIRDKAKDAYDNAVLKLRQTANQIAQQNANTSSRNATTNASRVLNANQARLLHKSPDVLSSLRILANLKIRTGSDLQKVGKQIDSLTEEQDALNAVMRPDAIVPNQTTNPNAYRQFMLQRAIAPARLAELQKRIPDLTEQYNGMAQEQAQYQSLMSDHLVRLKANGAPAAGQPRPTVPPPPGAASTPVTPRPGAVARPGVQPAPVTPPPMAPRPAPAAPHSAPAANRGQNTPPPQTRPSAPPGAKATTPAPANGKTPPHLIYDPITKTMKPAP